jgi:LysR family glycine cleavage system transcriptional activator
MKSLPPLNALQVFEAAARHSSFLKAARELHVTPSAISHQMKQLESFLEKRLFQRLDKRVELTRDGLVYFHQIQPALEKIDAATAELKTVTENLILTVSAAPVMATRWLMPRIYRFQEANPKLEIRIHASTDVADFSKSNVDVGIRHGGGQWERLVAHEIFREVLTPVCSNKLIMGKNQLQSPQDLLNFTLLQGVSRPDEWTAWFKAFKIVNPEISTEPTFQSRAQALEAAMLGLGIVLTDKRLVQQELKQGLLVAPLQEKLPNTAAFYLVYPESESESEKIVLFRDWILAEVESD